MVAISFNFEGWQFQHDVKRLENGYAAASRALQEDVDRAKEQAIGHQQSVEQGLVDDIIEADEDGWPVEMISAGLDYAVEAAETAIQDLRKAYALALYHKWERAARSWTNLNDPGHAKLVAAAVKLGFLPHPELSSLHLLANTLKHENAYWGERLLKISPDMLPNGSPPKSTSWYDAVELSEQGLARLFNAVRGSGPNELSP